MEDFDSVNKYGKSVRDAQYSAERLIRIGATDLSWLEKRVNDAVRPLHSSAVWPERLSVMSWTLVQEAAQAIIRRDRLSVEQYEAFVGGFRSVGVVVPDHPSAESS